MLSAYFFHFLIPFFFNFVSICFFHFLIPYSHLLSVYLFSLLTFFFSCSFSWTSSLFLSASVLEHISIYFASLSFVFVGLYYLLVFISLLHSVSYFLSSCFCSIFTVAYDLFVLIFYNTTLLFLIPLEPFAFVVMHISFLNLWLFMLLFLPQRPSDHVPLPLLLFLTLDKEQNLAFSLYPFSRKNCFHSSMRRLKQLRLVVRKLTKNTVFNWIVLVLVFLNSVVMSLQAYGNDAWRIKLIGLCHFTISY